MSLQIKATLRFSAAVENKYGQVIRQRQVHDKTNTIHETTRRHTKLLSLIRVVFVLFRGSPTTSVSQSHADNGAVLSESIGRRSGEFEVWRWSQFATTSSFSIIVS
jgi:hypothetical protein